MTALILLFMVFCSERGIASEYNSRGRRDPFVSLAGVAKDGTSEGIIGIYSVDDVVLQGIVIGPDGTYNAIINGEVIKAGDRIGRLSVEFVGNNVVEVKIGEMTHKLKLYDE